ncbi:hypothetical protein F4815DRAFT_227104 [Daldinia loculata]|nr:hypothetical protein F4815DRAFT_227104 [Daldinia loculata]
MADPFTALGTASSILTFVEFTWKLFASTYTIYKSATGENEDTTTLLTITKDVTRFGDAIILVPGCEDDLRVLVEEAQSIARDLHEALSKLKVRGTNTGWKSFKAALKEVWQSSQVKTFSERLSKLQTQIILHIQMLTLSRVLENSHTIAQFENTNRILGVEMQTGFQELREDVIAATTKLVPEDSISQPIKKHLKTQDATDIVNEDHVGEILANLQDLSVKITRLCEAGENTPDHQRVLKSLYFIGIRARQQKIPDAHTRTFAWVFEGKPPGFIDWLQHSSGIFWIQGKPGSGKSTLMKFLSSHDDIILHLEPWAQGKKLVVASFFFWNAGSPLQKSQEGLFRSLLFEILRSRPHLIPRVSALRVELRGHWDDDWSWTVNELYHICYKILEECTDTKFCFFLDGMDEYGAEKTELGNLVKSVQSLAFLPNIKLCVSSRPWSVFTEAFGQNPELSLKVEDLTRDDIRKYVSDKFEENRQFVELRDEEPTAFNFTDEICQRAQGVFLWVYLVVRDLLEGFTNGDSLGFLRDRLERFPEDLDAFFRHMIDAIEPIYHRSTARMFEIARLAPEPQLSVAYSFIDDIESNPKFAIELPVEPMSKSEVQKRQDIMRRRLDARSKGLLEFMTYSPLDRWGNLLLRVDFLHRTVREFLDRPDGLNSFLTQNLDDSNISSMMCNANLAIFKQIPREIFWGEVMESHIVKFIVDWAAKAEYTETSKTFFEILEAAESTYYKHPSPHDKTRSHNDFWGLVCRRNIPSYLEAKLNGSLPRIITHGSDPPLLFLALIWEDSADYPEDGHYICPGMIKILLDYGADPNETYDSETIWVHFLRYLTHEIYDKNAIKNAIELLVDHGADLEVPTSEVIKGWFTEDEYAALLIKWESGKSKNKHASLPIRQKPSKSKRRKLKSTFRTLLLKIRI